MKVEVTVILKYTVYASDIEDARNTFSEVVDAHPGFDIEDITVDAKEISTSIERVEVSR